MICTYSMGADLDVYVLTSTAENLQAFEQGGIWLLFDAVVNMRKWRSLNNV